MGKPNKTLGQVADEFGVGGVFGPKEATIPSTDPQLVDEAYGAPSAEQRGQILPMAMRETPEGPKWKWAVPGFLRDTALGIKDIAEGRTTDDGLLTSNGLTALTSASGVGMLPRGGTSLGMMAGKQGAENLAAAGYAVPLRRMAVAESMLNRGVDPDIIWQKTGIHFGPDGKPRFEISDDLATLKENSPYLMPGGRDRVTMNEIDSTGRRGQVIGADGRRIPQNQPPVLDDLISHPEVYNAYPELRDRSVRPESDPRNSASFSPDGSVHSYGANDPDRMLSSGLHEMQHDIQHIEGHANGVNPDSFLFPQFRKMYNETGQKLAQLTEKAKAAGIDTDIMNLQLKATGKLSPEMQEIMTEAGMNPRDVHLISSTMMQLDKYQENAMRRYGRSAGEVEARNTQARQFLSPEDRQQMHPRMTESNPWETGAGRGNGTGVPNQEVVILPNGHKALPVDHDPFASSIPVASRPESVRMTPMRYAPDPEFNAMRARDQAEWNATQAADKSQVEDWPKFIRHKARNLGEAETWDQIRREGWSPAYGLDNGSTVFTNPDGHFLLADTRGRRYGTGPHLTELLDQAHSEQKMPGTKLRRVKIDNEFISGGPGPIPSSGDEQRHPEMGIPLSRAPYPSSRITGGNL